MRLKSKAIYERSCRVIPGGVNSPVRSFRHLKTHPVIAKKGAGDQLTDVDGNEYTDFCLSWGALILGHAHPVIVASAYEQMQLGCSFGIATEIEEKIASKVCSILPHVEKLRFVNSGTEATMTAMRLARGFTEKPKIVKFSGHYHGHSDSLLIQAGSGVASLNPLATSKGVNLSTINDTICLPFNDFEAVRTCLRTRDDIAAVILEPVAGNMGVVPPEPGFLEMLRQETRDAGVLLIMDEVITGFRVGLQGASGRFKIDPDLTCLGKVIGGGFPVAAVGGKMHILDYLAPLGEVYQAGTLSGNPVAMRAGLETLEIIERPGFYDELERKAFRFTKPVLKRLQEKDACACINQVGAMFNIFFGVKKVRSKDDLKELDEDMFIRFFRFMLKRGIYISPSSHEAWFVSSVHLDEHIDEAVDYTLEFIDTYL